MDTKISSLLDSFSTLMRSSSKISPDEVVSLLDHIAEELNLSAVYVCENTGAKNHFAYPYVSHGSHFMTMGYNLIVMQDSDIHNFYNFFKDNNTYVFNDEISSKKHATAKGNLAYGFLENGLCIGFISFQPKEGDENRNWSEEEKEVIAQLGNLLRPLVAERESKGRIAYRKNLQSMSVGLFWYYPKLQLIIIPETTMDKFSIDTFIYRDAPSSFINEIASSDYVKQIETAFASLNDKFDNASIKFVSKKHQNVRFQLSIAINRTDAYDKPFEIMGMLEKLDEGKDKYQEKAEILKRYDKFRETISDNNHAEYYVNLLSGKMTVFKASNVFRDCFSDGDHFDDFIYKVCERFVAPENKDAFIKTLSSANLRKTLGKNKRSISLVTNFMIDGNIKRFETVVVMNTTSIYDYTKDAMIFVRDITFSESLNYDRLTGLLSMSHFLNKTKEYQSRGETDCSIIYFDFLQFKFFNLEYGISSGDALLKKFAEILRESYPDSYISRFADDHFVVLDGSKDAKENALEKVEKVLKEIKNESIFKHLTAKAGIYFPEGDIEPSIAVDYAQLACQSIKKDPRLNYRIYDKSLQAKNEKRKYVIEHIDEAIENEWIKLYYQPVVSSRDFSLVAMEALSRWIDPNIGFLSPADFIPALEENNLIYKLDLYVIDEICKKLRQEIDLGNKVVPISFNLSRNDFLSCKPFAEVEKAIRKYDIPRYLISIEITESVTMEDEELVHKAVEQFRDVGYEVWMDDFGSGYSSLNVLKDFSFDEIKFDMAFLRPLSEKSKIILGQTIEMANKLGIRTLSEGVESEEHVDFLRSCGCERLQGYYFSKPLPYNDLISTLKDKNISM